MSDLSDYVAADSAHSDQVAAAIREHPDFQGASEAAAGGIQRIIKMYADCDMDPDAAIAAVTRAAAQWAFWVYGEPGKVKK